MLAFSTLNCFKLLFFLSVFLLLWYGEDDKLPRLNPPPSVIPVCLYVLSI